MWKSEHQILLLYTGTLTANETTLCIVSRHCLNEYAYTYRTSTWTYCTPVNIKDEISARQCSRAFMILKSKEGWSGKRYQSKTSHLIMWNLQHPTQPKPTRQRRKKESALAWVLGRLTLHIAEHVRPNEGEDDDGHGQGVVGQGLTLVGIEVRPEGGTHKSGKGVWMRSNKNSPYWNPPHH